MERPLCPTTILLIALIALLVALARPSVLRLNANVTNVIPGFSRIKVDKSLASLALRGRSSRMPAGLRALIAQMGTSRTTVQLPVFHGNQS